jgi:hypothetical protein
MLPQIGSFVFVGGICARSTYYKSIMGTLVQSPCCTVPCETTKRFLLDFVARFYILVKPCQ